MAKQKHTTKLLLSFTAFLVVFVVATAIFASSSSAILGANAATASMSVPNDPQSNVSAISISRFNDRTTYTQGQIGNINLNTGYSDTITNFSTADDTLRTEETQEFTSNNSWHRTMVSESSPSGVNALIDVALFYYTYRIDDALYNSLMAGETVLDLSATAKGGKIGTEGDIFTMLYAGIGVASSNSNALTLSGFTQTVGAVGNSSAIHNSAYGTLSVPSISSLNFGSSSNSTTQKIEKTSASSTYKYLRVGIYGRIWTRAGSQVYFDNVTLNLSLRFVKTITNTNSSSHSNTARFGYQFTQSDIGGYDSSSKTFSMSVGTASWANTAWSASTGGNSDYHLICNDTYASGYYGSTTNFVDHSASAAVFNIQIPTFVKNLLNSGTVNIKVDYKLHEEYVKKEPVWGIMYQASYFAGYALKSSLVANVPVTMDKELKENDVTGATFFPGYTMPYDVDEGQGVGTINEDVDLSFSFDLTSSINYICLAYATANEDTDPVIGAWLKDIKLTLTYNGSITVESAGNGTFDCVYYNNGTYGSINSSGTTYTNQTKRTFTTQNPFVALKVFPKESTNGYRIRSVGGYTYNFGTSNWGTDLDNTKYVYLDPSGLSSRTLDNANRQTNLVASKSVMVRFTARTIKVQYVSNYDKNYTFNSGEATSDHFVTLFSTANTNFLKQAKTIFTDTEAFSAGWRYADYSSNGGSSYTDVTDENFSEGIQFTPNVSVTNNRFVFRLYVNWVEASASENSDYFSFTASNYEKLYSDVTYTITANKTGYNLTGVYAEYTSGDLVGERISLILADDANDSTSDVYESGSKFILYGISGNCVLYPEWKAISYYPVWNPGGGVTPYTDKEAYYGIGLTALDMPSVEGSWGWAFKGWKVTGTKVNGSSYEVWHYVPTDAISATCEAQFLAYDAGEMLANAYKQKTSDTTVTTVNESSSNGIVMPTSRVYNHGRNSNAPEVFSNNNHSYKFGGKTGIVIADAAKQNSKTVAYPIFIPVYFDGQLKKDILAGKITQVKIYVSADVYVGSGRLYDAIGASSKGNTIAYFDVWEGCTKDIVLNTDKDKWWYVSSNFSGSTASDNMNNGIETGDIKKGSTSYSGDYFYSKNSDHKLTVKSETKTETLTMDVSASNCTGFTIGLLIHMWNNASTYEVAHFGMMKNVKYYVSGVTASDDYKVTLNSNNPTGGNNSTMTTLKSSANGLGTYPAKLWEYNGYVFTGWSESSTATIGNLNLALNGTTSGKTYYAIWQKQKYPVLTYDVYTDGTSNVAEIRRAYYYEYGGSVTAEAGSSAYAVIGTTSHIYQGYGGHDYGGFAYQGTWYMGNSLSQQTCDWYQPNGSAPTVSSSVTQSSLTNKRPIYFGFYYIMEQPIVTILEETKAVDYGNSIDLDSLVSYSHGSNRGVILEQTWFSGAETSPYVFYKNGENVIYAFSESGNYYVTLKAGITIKGTNGNVTLEKTNTDAKNKVECDINALVLKLSPAEISELAYTGATQEFPFIVEIDSAHTQYQGYTAEQLADLSATLDLERNSNAWYYNVDGNNNEKWGNGLNVQLIALQYASALGQDAEGNNFHQVTVVGGVAQFKDAGTYTASQVDLRQYNVDDPEGSLNNYKNDFVWNNGQQSTTSSGAVSATITPATDLKIYSVYSRKLFGTISDPELDLINGSYTTLEGYFQNGYAGMEGESYSFIAIEGLLGSDFDAYSGIISSCWARDPGQSAGEYAVYINLFTDSGFVAGLSGLLNNYGVTISSLNATHATTSNISYIRVGKGLNDNGTEDDYSDDLLGNFTLSEAFNYTSATDTIGDSFKNFEILPVVLESPTYGASNNLTYNGQEQGVEVIFSGLLTDSQGGQIEISTYYKAILAPSDWDSLSEDEKLQYAKDHKAEAYNVGINGNGGVVDASKPTGVDSDVYDFLYFRQINAGTYRLLIVDTSNSNYKFDGYFLVEWTISKLALTPTITTSSSMVFGDANYGGKTYQFANVIDGDSLDFNVVASTPNDIGFRYNDSFNGVTNATTVSYYAKYAGGYTLTISNPVSTLRAHNDIYGPSFGSNYSLSNSIVSTWTVTSRTLAISSATPTHTDMVYDYNTAKGVSFTISGFYADYFSANDVTATGESHFLSDLFTHIDIVAEQTSGANAIGEAFDSTGTGAFTYTFTAYNRGTYNANITAILFDVDGNNYVNYTMAQGSTVYTIAPKPIKLDWTLTGPHGVVVDGNGQNVYSVVYDGNTYTLSAKFQVAEGASTTDDFKVYAEDHADGLITIVRGETPDVAIDYGSSIVSAKNVSTTDNETYVVVVTQVGGNYQIVTEGESSQTQVWAITRKPLTKIEFTQGLGETYTYDGNVRSVSFNLVGLVTGDTITSISGLNTNATAVASSTGYRFEAKNASVYTLKADISNQKVGTNYLLSVNVDETLFTINPLPLAFRFDNVTATYNASAITFPATLTNRVGTDELTWTYTYKTKTVYGTWTTVDTTVTELFNAGEYVVTISSFASNDPVTEANYTLVGATGLSQDCTINRMEVAVTDSAIVLPLDNTYSGSTISVTFAPLGDYLLDGEKNQDKYETNNVGQAGYSWESSGVISAINAGTYTASIIGISANHEGEDNYVLKSTVSKEWSIVRRELTIEWVPFNTYYYNSSDLTTKNGAVESGNGTLASPFTYYYNGEGSVGTADCRAVGVYVVIRSGLLAGDTVKLALAEQTVGTNNFYVQDPGGFTLPENGNAYTYTTANLNYYLVACATAVSGTAKGLTLNVYNKDGQPETNYILNYKMFGIDETSDTYATCYYQISARPVDVAWTLDGESNFTTTYSKINHVMSATIVGTVPGVTTGANLGGDHTQMNAGTYTAEVSSLTDINHVINLGKTQTWTIEKKVLSQVNWNQTSFEYDGYAHNPIATATTIPEGTGTADDGFAYEGDVIGFTYSGDLQMVVVGDYSITIASVDNVNYLLGSQVSTAYSITARTLTITWTGATQMEYDGTLRSVNLTISGVVSTDFDGNIDFVYTTLQGSTACESVTGDTVSNGIYTLSFHSTNVASYGVSIAIDSTKARKDCYVLSGDTEMTWSITSPIILIPSALQKHRCRSYQNQR